MKVAGSSHPSREKRKPEIGPGFRLKAAALSPVLDLSNSEGHQHVPLRCAQLRALPLPSHAGKEKPSSPGTEPSSPGAEPTAGCPQEVRATLCDPRQAQGPSPPPRCSAPPAPAVLTPHRPRHSPESCTAGGLWGRGPANSPGKEGKEGTPQTNRAGSLSQSIHCSLGGLSEQAGQGLGLTLSHPAGLHGAPGTLISAVPLPPARCLRPSTIAADSSGWTKGVLPCSPWGRLTHFYRSKTRVLSPRGQGLQVVSAV